MTRPFTPTRRNPDGSTTITVQRACNGCGHEVGDVTKTEIDTVMSGKPLPDVRDECPVCGHKELVGPVPSVTFGGGPYLGPNSWGARPKVAYVPPRNTCDPRYEACTDHHVACDCREAEFAEQIDEWRHERGELQKALESILVGHLTRSDHARFIGFIDGQQKWEYDDSAHCSCTGCQIARAIHLYPKEAV